VLGRELGNFGDVQVGVTRQRAGVRSVIPEDPQGTELRGYGTSQFAQYRADTLDSLGFPSRGYLLEARMERVPGDSGGAAAEARSTLIGMAAISGGNWAGHVYGEYAHSNNGYSPLSLGGFLRLSGTVPPSVTGSAPGFHWKWAAASI
jgi:NTE family protein